MSTLSLLPKPSLKLHQDVSKTGAPSLCPPFLTSPLPGGPSPRTPAPPAGGGLQVPACRAPARPAAPGLGAWRPPSSARGKASRRRPCGEETKKTTIKIALPSLVSAVSGAPAACCTHERGICHSGVELGAEACLAPRRAAARRGCGAELAGWDRVVARLCWAPSERHTPTLPFHRRAPRGAPKLKDERFLLESLSQKLSPLVAGATSESFVYRTAPLFQEASWRPLSCPQSFPTARSPGRSSLSPETPLGTRCAWPCPPATCRDFFCSHVDPVAEVKEPCSLPMLSVDMENKENGSVGVKNSMENGRPPDPADWAVMDVVNYFRTAGFEEQASAFQEQEIDGKSLLLMTRNDVLTGLQLKLGPALKIYEYHVKPLQTKHLKNNSS
ncbi:sterile alpha motif domain-containing protein 13 [Eumetopias jubatus]|uniref:sterile alpha motif domain-containing protein 13 n=1 Tax=Eumetopias jubatus TaxID=34886 RepID=UPI001016DB36|nr:sterile alpha motif domain-containing protein 13 [Eumetopias jubatus]